MKPVFRLHFDVIGGTPLSTQVANEPATLTEAILGKELITAPIFSKVRAWPAELRAALFSVLLASAVLLPYLGAVGLWDPWEVQYGWM